MRYLIKHISKIQPKFFNLLIRMPIDSSYYVMRIVFAYFSLASGVEPHYTINIFSYSTENVLVFGRRPKNCEFISAESDARPIFGIGYKIRPFSIAASIGQLR